MLQLNLLGVELLGVYAIIAGISIALVATAAVIAMGKVVEKVIDSIARQPEAEGKIKSNFILGLVFMETAIIYVLVIAILIVLNVL